MAYPAAMILLRSILILLVLALTPAHVAADGPQVMAGAHAMAQMDDCCESGTHQTSCQMQTPLPEGATIAVPLTPARPIDHPAAPERRQGRSPGLALRPPILS